MKYLFAVYQFLVRVINWIRNLPVRWQATKDEWKAMKDQANKP